MDWMSTSPANFDWAVQVLALVLSLRVRTTTNESRRSCFLTKSDLHGGGKVLRKSANLCVNLSNIAHLLARNRWFSLLFYA